MEDISEKQILIAFAISTLLVILLIFYGNTQRESIKVISEQEIQEIPADAMILDDFENERQWITESGSNLDIVLYRDDCESKCLKVDLSSENFDNKESWALALTYPVFKDWRDYRYLNVWIKPNDVYGVFEVDFIEEDQDRWIYQDDKILSNPGWQHIKIPLTDFKEPPWQKNNNKMDLNILHYQLVFIVQNQHSNVWIDNIYLSSN